MSSATEIFRQMPSRFNASAASGTRTYYFSIDSTKRTVTVSPDGCKVEEGKTVDAADCVLKTTEKIFVAMVTKGKSPGPIDIARGKFKTNDPDGLMKLKELFSF